MCGDIVSFQATHQHGTKVIPFDDSGDEARNNTVNFDAVFLNLTENNRAAILLLAESYHTDVVTGSRKSTLEHCCTQGSLRRCAGSGRYQCCLEYCCR